MPGVVAWGAERQPPLQLQDGDRVAFVGSALLEREQVGGYIETMLITAFPDKNVTFRNLAYSGDTVAGDARGLCTGWSTFESADQGFNRLRKITAEVQPTVLIVNYGMNESFAGPAGVEGFIAGYNRMIDMLTSAARGKDGKGAAPRQVVLLSPNYHEDLGRPLPDPTDHNRNLELYSKAIADLAAKRGYMFVDLYTITRDAGRATPLTSNGIHLTPFGYWRTAISLEEAMGLPMHRWSVSIDARSGQSQADGTSVSDVKAHTSGLEMECADELLPIPSAPENSPSAAIPEAQRVLKVTGLAPGNYELKAGDQVMAHGTADQWVAGVHISGGPMEKQVEQLRSLVIQKNFDFFNYWRPENDSYILSFRKHEQGKLAVELPEFKPVAKAKEDEIARLRKPVPVKYVLRQVAESH